jgi:ABC-type tungstate transport system substrate-binding protein
LKQFIVLAAVLPILLAFVMQFTLIQVHHSRLIRAEEAIHSARIEAGISGGFTTETRAALAAKLAAIYGVAPAEIGMSLDMEDGQPRHVIAYKITLPVSQIIAANRLFGISDSDNSGYYTIEGETLNLSEYMEAVMPISEASS